MEKHICDTPITGNFVAEHMKQALGPHAVLKAIKDAKRIAVGQGFMSNILRVELEWEKEQENLPKSVIIKVPSVDSMHKLMDTLTTGKDEGEKMKAMMGQMAAMIYKAECDLYTMFGNNPPVKMPKFYVALPVQQETPGMIILEDLSDKGDIPPSFIEGLTYPQLLAAITELARLHAWSLTTAVDWRSKAATVEDREQVMRGMMAAVGAGFKLSKESYPNEFGTLDLAKMTEMMNYDAFIAAMNEHREYMDDVLAHGDFYQNNIIFEKNPDGSVSDRLLALIDFQGAMRGSPTYDIARLVSFCISHKMRREHTEDILRRYFDEVKSIAGDKFKATFDQFRHTYDRQFALNSLFMVSCIPTMNHMAVKSEGEQKLKDEKVMLERMKANYDDARKILGL